MFRHHAVLSRSIHTSSVLPSSSSSRNPDLQHYNNTTAVFDHQCHGRGLGGPGGLIGDSSRGTKGIRLTGRLDADCRKELRYNFGDGLWGIGGARCFASLKEEEFLTEAEQPSDRSSNSSSSSSSSNADGPHADPISSMEGKSLWRKLTQNVNVSGISFTARVIVKDRRLAIPHVSVPDISWIDWKALRIRGFEGVLFDKDNTLTAPYGQNIWPPLTASLEECREVFGGRIALLSNSTGMACVVNIHLNRLPPDKLMEQIYTRLCWKLKSEDSQLSGFAGLYQYDPHGAEAKLVESRLGIHVIRHGQKKPAGKAIAVSNYFSCDPSMLIMVGDRYFTDVVYGNNNGLLTIRSAPLTKRGEPFIVKRVRRVEETLVDWWCRQGCLPPKHRLFDNPVEFIKDPGCW